MLALLAAARPCRPVKARSRSSPARMQRLPPKLPCPTAARPPPDATAARPPTLTRPRPPPVRNAPPCRGSRAVMGLAATTPAATTPAGMTSAETPTARTDGASARPPNRIARADRQVKAMPPIALAGLLLRDSPRTVRTALRVKATHPSARADLRRRVRPRIAHVGPRARAMPPNDPVVPPATPRPGTNAGPATANPAPPRRRRRWARTVRSACPSG